MLQQESLEDLLWSMATRIGQLLEFDDCVIYLLENETLTQVAAYGLKNPVGREIFEPICIPLGQGITGRVAKTGRSEMVDDVRGDSHYINDQFPGVSELTVPIFFEGRVIGVIDSESDRVGAYTKSDMEILEWLAAAAAPRIRHAREEKARRAAQSELAEANKKLKSFSQTLNAQVQERTRELQVAKNKAVDALAVKSQFVAQMNHELRTPLNGLLGLVNSAIEASSEESVLSLLVKAKESGLLLTDLINSVLDFSKLEAGQMQVNNTPTDISDFIQDTTRLFEHAADAKGIDLMIDVDVESGATFMVDRNRLTQVVTNLVGNAIKFTDSGHVRIGVTRENESLLLYVEDTGIGIAQENLALVFEPFTQTEEVTTGFYGGTGLGLTICKQIADLLGGQLRVESRQNEGTKFSFVFPAVQLSSDSKPEKPQINYTALRGKKILVVEDNPINRQVAELFLKKANMQVASASNGQQGLQAAESGDFDAILMDLQMPVMDGEEAARLIRLSGNAVPILACTANTDERTKESCLAAGMNGFVTKPVNFESLVEAILAVVAE